MEERWLKGPNFLREPELNWMNYNQESYTMMENDPELKKTVVTFTSTVIQNEDPLTSFIEKFLILGSFMKRMTAWILKFKSLLRLLSKRRKEILLSISRKNGQEQQTASGRFDVRMQKRTWFTNLILGGS